METIYDDIILQEMNCQFVTLIVTIENNLSTPIKKPDTAKYVREIHPSQRFTHTYVIQA